MHGRTISIHGTTTHHTASEVHGTGAATTTHGTATHGIGTDGTAHIHTTTADGTTHGTTEAGMIHTTTEDCGTHGTTGAIMEATTDGIRIGATTITTTTLPLRSTMRTDGTVTADRADQTECSQAGFPQEEALQAQAG